MTYYNLEIIQGSSLNILVTATDQNGTAINLSGYNVRGWVKSKFSENGYILDLNPTIYSAASGIVQIFVSGTQTSGLFIGSHPYDLEAASSGDITVTKFLRGYANIYPETTNI
jgi:hypothetical protein